MLHHSGAETLMVWQTPSCFTSRLVRYSRAGECRASSFLTTYVLLLGPLPALLARRHYYSCYQLFLSVSFGPADEKREERTRDYYIVQSSSVITVPRRGQEVQRNPHHSSRSIRPKDGKATPNMPCGRCPNKWSSQTYNSFTHNFFPDACQ